MKMFHKKIEVEQMYAISKNGRCKLKVSVSVWRSFFRVLNLIVRVIDAFEQ